MFVQDHRLECVRAPVNVAELKVRLAGFQERKLTVQVVSETMAGLQFRTDPQSDIDHPSSSPKSHL